MTDLPAWLPQVGDVVELRKIPPVEVRDVLDTYEHRMVAVGDRGVVKQRDSHADGRILHVQFGDVTFAVYPEHLTFIGRQH